MDWKDVKVQVVAGVSVALVLIMFAWLSTRASAGDVEAVKSAHAEDMTEVDERLDKLEPAVRQVQVTTQAIAVFLDRKDKEGGGEGLPDAALEMELLE